MTEVSDGDTSSLANLKSSRGANGVISLREAIQAANSISGPDTIEFSIAESVPGYEVSGITGTWTISPTAGLPALSDRGDGDQRDQPGGQYGRRPQSLGAGNRGDGGSDGEW